MTVSTGSTNNTHAHAATWLWGASQKLYSNVISFRNNHKEQKEPNGGRMHLPDNVFSMKSNKNKNSRASMPLDLTKAGLKNHEALHL